MRSSLRRRKLLVASTALCLWVGLVAPASATKVEDPTGHYVSVAVNEQADGLVAIAHNGNAYGECSIDVVIGCFDGSVAVSTNRNADAGIVAVSGTGQATSRTVAVSGTGSAVGGCSPCLWPGVAFSGTGSADGGTVAFSGPRLVNAAIGTVPPAPSAPLGNTDLILATPIEAEDLLESVPIPSLAAPIGASATADDDCKGCLARNVMQWKDYGGYESVRAKQSVNVADETITRQDLHAALINSVENECYNGNVRWNNSWSGNGYSDSASLSSGYYTAWSDKWTQASGHNWYEGSIHWYVDGGADICKQF